jgi:hypothetical protein
MTCKTPEKTPHQRLTRPGPRLNRLLPFFPFEGRRQMQRAITNNAVKPTPNPTPSPTPNCDVEGAGEGEGAAVGLAEFVGFVAGEGVIVGFGEFVVDEGVAVELVECTELAIVAFPLLESVFSVKVFEQQEESEPQQ